MKPTTLSSVEYDLLEIAETGIMTCLYAWSNEEGIFLSDLWYVAQIVLLLLFSSFAIFENFNFRSSFRYLTMASSDPRQSLENIPTGMQISFVCSISCSLTSCNLFNSSTNLETSFIFSSFESPPNLETMLLKSVSSTPFLSGNFPLL